MCTRRSGFYKEGRRFTNAGTTQIYGLTEFLIALMSEATLAYESR